MYLLPNNPPWIFFVRKKLSSWALTGHEANANNNQPLFGSALLGLARLGLVESFV